MITTMAYQRNPEHILWATLSDGMLISMTYDPLHNVYAWARHPMELGDTSVVLIPEIPAVPAVPDSYKYTYMNDISNVYGVPIVDTGLLTLDDGGTAVDQGGGIVEIPYAGNPFVSGEVVRLTGTSNYDGLHTLTAGTTTGEMQFTDTFNAETFDGSETVLKQIANLDAGAGRMAADSEGNIYIAHGLNEDASPDNYYMTKIEPDGTISYDYDFLNTSWSDSGATTRIALGIKILGTDLYISIQSTSIIQSIAVVKFNLADKTAYWGTGFTARGVYGFDVDADGNAYVTFTSGGVGKYANADGGLTRFPDMTGAYVCHVDNTLGILCNAGAIDGGSNLWVRALDGSAADEIALGASTIGTTHLTSDGEFIYAVAGGVLYKVAWDGTSLSIDSQTGALGIGQGLYIDLYDNLVVVNQTAGGTEDDVLYFYDKDLNAISNTTGMHPSMLASWASTVGGSWQSGNIVFNGALDGTPEIPAIPAVTGAALGLGATSVAVIPGITERTEDEVWVSLARVIGGEIVRYIERLRPFNWGLDNKYMFFVDSGLTYDGGFTTTISGLDHLEGEEVAILGNGAVLPSQEVVGGAVTLDESVAVASVGLPFTYKLKPMRMDQSTPLGTSKGSIKKFAEAVISFEKTLNAKYGDGETTYKIPWRETSADYSSPPDLVTGDKVVVTDGGFNVEDPIEITGSDPMPCTVRAIIPRVEITGR